MNPQWQFPLEALRQTPSTVSIQDEMSRRQRGIDWLMRMGATLNMGLGPCLTGATYFHRFYMRRMLEDYNELEIAATCLFLASKTEENGKRLEDVVTVMLAKVHGIPPAEVAGAYENEAKSLEHLVLTYEEVLLEVLCFDFDVRYPHTYLADIIATYDATSPDPILHSLIDCAWSVAHDSYRTPLCILLPPQIIAAASFLFAQCLAEGPNSPSLTERLEVANSTDTRWRQVLGISENDVQQVAGK
ncbi:hypothetical protein M408DRAFT_194950 [Serendipita vermifera MAFF 305830]|uniref:Cyclin-like domain-containing protein n=1 Tax=Serendipita vermifera MAFF 305830 TaxID=933852 RepID=A0A0C3B285_SERVB|nr:hypothetical protein M408DRAFT_194950 [Serendipita vermifera MAFF 305830]